MKGNPYLDWLVKKGLRIIYQYYKLIFTVVMHMFVDQYDKALGIMFTRQSSQVRVLSYAFFSLWGTSKAQS